jgi:hypothetical protein
MTTRRVIWALLVAWGCSDPPDIVEQVLALPATPPDWRTHPAVIAHRQLAPPPADAELETLLWFWRCPRGTNPLEPDGATRARFLRECRRDPALLAEWQHLLPPGEVSAKLVRMWREREREPLERLRLAGHRFDGEAESPEETRRRARDARGTDGAWHLEDYATSGDEAVLPILRALGAEDRPQVSVTALALLHDLGTPADCRAAVAGLLRLAVSDRDDDRDDALRALVDREWPGREEWLTSLLRDEVTWTRYVEWPLERFALEAPHRRLPVLRELLASENHRARAGAVACLLAIALQEDGEAALRLLLPWLKDPGWAPRERRVELLRRLLELRVPEGAAGVREVLRSGNAKERLLAARILAPERDPKALDELRRQWDRVGAWQESDVLKELIAGGGIDAGEAVAGIVKVARLLASYRAELAMEGDGNRPETWWPVGGRHTLYACLAREPGEMAERLAPALLTRADELFATEPATALELLVLVHGWPCRSASLDLVRRIAEGRAPPRCIRAGIKGRDHVREHAADELQRLVEGGGVAGGFAAAITGDARAVFASVDAAAQRALLAAARLGPVVLPVESVLPLLDARDFGLATTAARYLESVDDPAARAALHERGLGPEPRAPWEAALRAERKAAGGPIEIYFWSDEHQGGRETTTIRCFADHVELAHSDEGGREWRRPLPPGEWRELKAFLERNRIDELPDLPCQAADGIWHHYLHVTREGAAALYVNNPGNSWPDDAIYEKLAFRFQSLRQRGEFELHYA